MTELKIAHFFYQLLDKISNFNIKTGPGMCRNVFKNYWTAFASAADPLYHRDGCMVRNDSHRVLFLLLWSILLQLHLFASWLFRLSKLQIAERKWLKNPSRIPKLSLLLPWRIWRRLWRGRRFDLFSFTINSFALFISRQNIYPVARRGFALQYISCTYASEDLRMFNDTSIPLFLKGELLADLRANDSDIFWSFLLGRVQELGVTGREELLLDWLSSFLAAEEQERLMAWCLVLSVLFFWEIKTKRFS